MCMGCSRAEHRDMGNAALCWRRVRMVVNVNVHAYVLESSLRWR